MQADDNHGPDGKLDAWDSANDPGRLSNGDFEYNISQLPMEGWMDQLPVPGDYWPTARDSINFRWNSGEASPTEKYAKAFGVNPDKLRRAVSEKFGLLSKSFPSCDPTHGDSDCNDGAECSYVPDGSRAFASRAGGGSVTAGRRTRFGNRWLSTR